MVVSLFIRELFSDESPRIFHPEKGHDLTYFLWLVSGEPGLDAVIKQVIETCWTGEGQGEPECTFRPTVFHDP